MFCEEKTEKSIYCKTICWTLSWSLRLVQGHKHKQHTSHGLRLVMKSVDP